MKLLIVGLLGLNIWFYVSVTSSDNMVGGYAPSALSNVVAYLAFIIGILGIVLGAAAYIFCRPEKQIEKA